MKLLHTSDWHIGHELYGYDRADDFRDIARQIADIVATEQPDAMLVSGDIFHTANPSAAAQSILGRALVDIGSRHPSMPVILTAGNHDGASRLEAFSEPMRKAGIIIVGNAPRSEDADEWMDRQLVEAGGGYILPVPYMLSSRYRDTFLDALKRLADRLPEGRPLVVAAHTTVAGCDFAGHNDADEHIVGGIESITPEAAGAGIADYVALGHIHRRQAVRGSHGRACYSGSPLAVSFDEQYTHSVSVVEITERGSVPVVRTIPLEQRRPLLTLGGADGTTWKEMLLQLKRLKKEPPPRGAFFRLNVVVDNGETLPPDADSIASALIAEAEGNFCLINGIIRKREGAAGQTRMSLQLFRSMAPADIAAAYAQRVGRRLTEPMLRLFDLAKQCAESPDNPQ